MDGIRVAQKCVCQTSEPGETPMCHRQSTSIVDCDRLDAPRGGNLNLLRLARPFFNAALVVAILSWLACGAEAALADQKVCQALEQRYEQIEKAATSIEVNAT